MIAQKYIKIKVKSWGFVLIFSVACGRIPFAGALARVFSEGRLNMENNARVKLACYITNISMAVVSNISPLFFLTFHRLYEISYSLLGLLVLVNFVTQLTVDLIFSFFSHKFNIPAAVKLTPVLTFIGLIVYSLWPLLFPETAYLGLVVGTVLFAASGGLSEVLISPVIAAIPAKDPDREMSKLHSIYAWGVVAVVILTTLMLFLFEDESWHFISLFFAIVPVFAAAFFFGARIPEMGTPERSSGALGLLRSGGVWLCILAIFLGGATECTMAQWASGYLEAALGIDKIWGDVFGVALFGLTLALGRSLYAKYGKKIEPVLFFCAIGAAVCYLVTALSPIPVISLIASALTGFFASMLWPGSLIVASERYPAGGVFIFAMMASGGDLGASVGPQLIGIITDAAMASEPLISFAAELGISAEQLGMKLGMLVGMIFPLIAIAVYLIIWRGAKKKAAEGAEASVK